MEVKFEEVLAEMERNACRAIDRALTWGIVIGFVASCFFTVMTVILIRVLGD